MQTPIQQAISELKETLKICLPEFKTGIQHSILQLSAYLEPEKQAFKDFYNQGYRDGERIGELAVSSKDISEFNNAENYYNDTFKPNLNA